MELISASRIMKAQARVAAARPYAEQITAVIGNLAAGGAGLTSPLLVPRDQVRRVGFVVITSDRGMAGAYNANVIRTAERGVRRHAQAGNDALASSWSARRAATTSASATTTSTTRSSA